MHDAPPYARAPQSAVRALVREWAGTCGTKRCFANGWFGGSGEKKEDGMTELARWRRWL